jgi:hypothetical protein
MLDDGSPSLASFGKAAVSGGSAMQQVRVGGEAVSIFSNRTLDASEATHASSSAPTPAQEYARIAMLQVAGSGTRTEDAGGFRHYISPRSGRTCLIVFVLCLPR